MEDPLNINVAVGDVDTSIPLLPEADYLCVVQSSSIDPNKEKVGHNWNMKLGTVDGATDINGREVRPGFPLFVNNIALQPRDGSTDPSAFRRGIASAIDAIFGTTKGNRPDFNRGLVDQAVGKTVIAHVVIDEYQGNSMNKVKRLKKATE